MTQLVQLVFIRWIVIYLVVSAIPPFQTTGAREITMTDKSSEKRDQARCSQQEENNV